MKKKLSIAHIHWGFHPIIGGVETHLAILLPELKKRGFKTSLLTNLAKRSKLIEKYRGIDIFRNPLMDLAWLSNKDLQRLNDDLFEMFHNFVEEVKPDIIHTHNMNYFSVPHAKNLERVAKKAGIPLMVTAHNFWDDMLFIKLSNEIEWAHHIAVSRFIRRELVGAGVDKSNISVIHHGIDTKKFNPNVSTAKTLKKRPELKNRKIIFHPARMGLNKGCDVSIKAIRHIIKEIPNALLVLAGSRNIIDWNNVQTDEISYFHKMIDFFGLSKNIYIDSYHLNEMPALYNIADVCLYPSTAPEPFGLTMLESMASSKPIIVTKMGGMPEIINDGVNGYLVRVRDFEAIAKRTVELLQNDHLRENMGKTGLAMVNNMYTKDLMINKHIKVYRRVSG